MYIANLPAPAKASPNQTIDPTDRQCHRQGDTDLTQLHSISLDPASFRRKRSQSATASPDASPRECVSQRVPGVLRVVFAHVPTECTRAVESGKAIHSTESKPLFLLCLSSRPRFISSSTSSSSWCWRSWSAVFFPRFLFPVASRRSGRGEWAADGN